MRNQYSDTKGGIKVLNILSCKYSIFSSTKAWSEVKIYVFSYYENEIEADLFV